jgi:uncharacterized protein YggE
MADAPVVAVRGEAIREVAPELAGFSVTVTARDKDRQTTLTRLTQRLDAVRTVLDGYADAIERRETAGVAVHPAWKKAGERVSAYHGSVATTVTMTDFTALGELLLRLADQDQTSIAGPWWELRPTSPVYAEARRAAVAEAIARAREYADALGARVTSLLELADAGMGGGGQPKMRAMSFGTAMDAGGPPQLELEPQRQTVHALVEARFAISDPTALS